MRQRAEAGRPRRERPPGSAPHHRRAIQAWSGTSAPPPSSFSRSSRTQGTPTRKSGWTSLRKYPACGRPPCARPGACARRRADSRGPARSCERWPLVARALEGARLGVSADQALADDDLRFLIVAGDFRAGDTLRANGVEQPAAIGTRRQPWSVVVHLARLPARGASYSSRPALTRRGGGPKVPAVSRRRGADARPPPDADKAQ